MSTLMMFRIGLHVLQFEDGGAYPASRPVEIFQVSDMVASGGRQVETLGVTKRKRQIAFDSMSQTDYDNLINWFVDIVNGGAVTFEFIDERGFAGDVKILDSIIDFPEVSFQRYSGLITVEYQT